MSYCVTVMAQMKLIAEMTVNESSLGREERPDGTYPSSTLDTRWCFHRGIESNVVIGPPLSLLAARWVECGIACREHWFMIVSPDSDSGVRCWVARWCKPNLQRLTCLCW